MKLSRAMERCLGCLCAGRDYLPRWHGAELETLRALERRRLIRKNGRRARRSTGERFTPTGLGWKTAFKLLDCGARAQKTRRV